ncbi:MAG: acyl-CoA dehydrogenase family protein [Anaerolineae bacterium]|nr:acyl-CoA dehydrogenase family protein [Anaerolineae bacterium]NUQ03783.1 acyl-CoA dehydrogenase family protein [Anaerolineae bacterium]
MLEFLSSPSAFLRTMGVGIPDGVAEPFESYWQREGLATSAALDRAGTPWVRQFDRFGRRIDEISFPPAYWTMLHTSYQAGAVWRALEESMPSAYVVGYLTCYFDVGLYCPHTVSLGTAAAIAKYAAPEVRERFLPALLRRDDAVWQGATWMTEARGGSDLGATVETLARQTPDGWRLTGDKYFCSNVGAELAVVAARPEGAPPGVRGLALFLTPRLRSDGSLNYHVRRLKDKIATRSVPTGEVELDDSEAFFLGEPGHGIYHILEVLNLSRVSNSVGAVALMQRALADACSFAARRDIFAMKLIDQPLMRHQITERLVDLRAAFALAWESVRMAEEVWREPAPRYSERFQRFRILVHLAKYWTAELAVQTAKWAMEVNGGMGTLAEFGVERHLREAMILNIWEGPPHRQIIDGFEALERKSGYRLLFDHLAPHADAALLEAHRRRLEAHFALPADQQAAQMEDVFRSLAQFTAATLASKYPALSMA